VGNAEFGSEKRAVEKNAVMHSSYYYQYQSLYYICHSVIDHYCDKVLIVGKL
jgi:hypothetical protein